MLKAHSSVVWNGDNSINNGGDGGKKKNGGGGGGNGGGGNGGGVGIVVGGGKGFVDCDDEEDCVDEGSGSGDGPDFLPPIGGGGGGGGVQIGDGGGGDLSSHVPGGTDSECRSFPLFFPRSFYLRVCGEGGKVWWAGGMILHVFYYTNFKLVCTVLDVITIPGVSKQQQKLSNFFFEKPPRRCTSIPVLCHVSTAMPW